MLYDERTKRWWKYLAAADVTCDKNTCGFYESPSGVTKHFRYRLSHSSKNEHKTNKNGFLLLLNPFEKQVAHGANCISRVPLSIFSLLSSGIFIANSIGASIYVNQVITVQQVFKINHSAFKIHFAS